jgi:hypothetical protein
MKRLNLIFLILGWTISACSSAPQVAPSAVVEPTPIQWIPSTPNPTGAPSTSSPSIPTHDELEHALVSRVHWESNALCEWEVAEQTSQAIYVWAYCQSVVNDSAVSAPAVIRLGSDGHLQSVDTPRDGADYGPDIRALFPPDLQQRIFDQAFDIEKMGARLTARRAQSRATPTQQPSPTIASTLTATSPAADGWQVYHDASFGLSLQYPSDWRQSIRWYSPGWHGIVERIEVTHLSQPTGENAEILIDIWQSQHDLLTWLHDRSPDSLALNSATIEDGLDTLTRYNAQLAGYPAVFVYDREHNSGTPDVADVFVADGQRIYRFMYWGDVPDNLANRATYLRILETVSLANSTLQGLSLPKTSFITGVTWTPATPTIGSAVFGQVIAGYGDHRPVSGLPLWIGETSSGEPAAYTSDAGYFALTHLPTGTVHVVDDHLAFQVTIPGEGTAVYPGQLKYPLIHPPTYYMQSPAPLPDLATLLDTGQSIDFSTCLTDADWKRQTTQAQRDRVWAKRPFSDTSAEWLRWWFSQPAMIYDTTDHFVQSFPDGPNLDFLLADWRYLSGMWNTADVVDQSGCPYDSRSLENVLARRQIEVWLWGYRAVRLHRLDQHFGLEVTAAPGYQIIRFPGLEDAIAIHLVENGREILSLPQMPPQQWLGGQP